VAQRDGGVGEYTLGDADLLAFDSADRPTPACQIRAPKGCRLAPGGLAVDPVPGSPRFAGQSWR